MCSVEKNEKAESEKKCRVENLRACASTTSFSDFSSRLPTQSKSEGTRKLLEKGTTQQSAENENPNVNKNAAFKAKTLGNYRFLLPRDIPGSFFSFFFFC
jgi:hypothetical protein